MARPHRRGPSGGGVEAAGVVPELFEQEAPLVYSIVREEKGLRGKYICIEALTPIYLG
jgi:hypothetical protein